MSLRGPAFTPLGAIALMSAAFATFLVVGNVVAATGAPTLLALCAGQVAFAAFPVVACVRTQRPLAAIGLARAPARMFVAAVLVGVSAWYVNAWLVSLLSLPEGDTAPLEQAVEASSLAFTVLGIGLVPAICEELVFRGLVLRALASRFVPVAAVVASAALFSAYHLSPVQALPTLTLGLLLGLLAVRGGSVLPTMLAHLLNNTMAIVVHRRVLPGVSWMDQHAGATLAIAAATTTAGIVLALRSKVHQ
ncbi:MAG: CPBP family intramembrane glutamic endopeptidase [Kofleriaceae bacterium]|nr:CPBP family intramembrane glutamic endopeptidase [Kofleriaceae bacterium]